MAVSHWNDSSPRGNRATLVTSDFSHSKNRAVINQVPLARYFAFVGSVLLGMMFIANWYWPSASSQTFFREARVDKSIIRITSAQKWPEPLVIDTSLPTICPTAAGLGKSSDHQPATRCVNSVETSIAESLGIFGQSEAQSRCTTSANRGLSSDPGGAAR
jgi:hypothetical protein